MLAILARNLEELMLILTDRAVYTHYINEAGDCERVVSGPRNTGPGTNVRLQLENIEGIKIESAAVCGCCKTREFLPRPDTPRLRRLSPDSPIGL
jgi:hypothetical protein